MAAEYGTILVTGVSGYVGSHVAKLLLDTGYKVRGTVRSLKNENKIAPLRSLAPNSQFPIELVEADLTKDEGWDKALEGCRGVMHVASPFPDITQDSLEGEKGKILVETAKGGTLRVLKAAADAKVEKVVLTSSFAAVLASAQCEKRPYNEEDWTNLDDPNLDPYSRSKTVAEKSAWDFIKELPDDNKMELAVVNPTLVLGPILLESHKSSTSVHVIQNMLIRAFPAHPKFAFPLCDVRDVAQAHLKALLNPNATGNRHIIVTQNLFSKEIGNILNKEFRPQGYSVPIAEAPNFLIWLTSFFDKRLGFVLPRLGVVMDVDNKRMREVLGIPPTNVQDSILEMGYSLIEFGIVKKTKKYKQSGRYAETQESETPTKTEDLKSNDVVVETME